MRNIADAQGVITKNLGLWEEALGLMWVSLFILYTPQKEVGLVDHSIGTFKHQLQHMHHYKDTHVSALIPANI